MGRSRPSGRQLFPVISGREDPGAVNQNSIIFFRCPRCFWLSSAKDDKTSAAASTVNAAWA